MMCWHEIYCANWFLDDYRDYVEDKEERLVTCITAEGMHHSLPSKLAETIEVKIGR